MERRLKMMIAGSIAVWVPVASATQAQPAVVDPGKVYRLKASPAPDGAAACALSRHDEAAPHEPPAPA